MNEQGIPLTFDYRVDTTITVTAFELRIVWDPGEAEFEDCAVRSGLQGQIFFMNLPSGRRVLLLQVQSANPSGVTIPACNTIGRCQFTVDPDENGDFSLSGKITEASGEMTSFDSFPNICDIEDGECPPQGMCF
jgi:hypothetical protein